MPFSSLVIHLAVAVCPLKVLIGLQCCCFQKPIRHRLSFLRFSFLKSLPTHTHLELLIQLEKVYKVWSKTKLRPCLNWLVWCSVSDELQMTTAILLIFLDRPQLAFLCKPWVRLTLRPIYGAVLQVSFSFSLSEEEKKNC